MADSVRTKTQLIADYADNTAGDISAGDLRNFVESVYGKFYVSETTSDVTLSGDNVLLYVNTSGGNVTVTLPALADYLHKFFIIKKADTSDYTIIVSGADNIDGASSYTISGNYCSVIIEGTSTEWSVIANKANTCTASNVGGSNELFKQKTDNDLEFRTLSAGTNITITSASNTLTIGASAAAGERNTASSVGGSNEVFKQKSGVDLEFRTISAGSNIAITSGTNVLTISGTPENTASSVGGSNEVFKQKSGVDLEFRTISAGPRIAIVSAANTLSISANDPRTNYEMQLPAIGSTNDTDIGIQTMQTVSGSYEPSTVIEGFDSGKEGFIDYYFIARGVAPTNILLRYYQVSGASVDVTATDAANAIPTSGTSINNTSESWATITLSGISGGTWTAGSLFRVRLTAKVDNGEKVYAGYCRVYYE